MVFSYPQNRTFFINITIPCKMCLIVKPHIVQKHNQLVKIILNRPILMKYLFLSNVASVWLCREIILTILNDVIDYIIMRYVKVVWRFTLYTKNVLSPFNWYIWHDPFLKITNSLSFFGYIFRDTLCVIIDIELGKEEKNKV